LHRSNANYRRLPWTLARNEREAIHQQFTPTDKQNVPDREKIDESRSGQQEDL